MKKIMFNDKYGLTKAVLYEKKTQTRRICRNQDNPTIEESRYKVGETIAVAQSYEEYADGINDEYWREQTYIQFGNLAGWRNKMFVRADLMTYQIKITNIRIERLQDISEADCLAEGIYEDYNEHGGWYCTPFYDFKNNKDDGFDTPREAFAALIDKVSGKDTWNSNPFVYVYEFELVK